MYFTADTHFGHTNILKLCRRPFETIEEMNEDLIARWNSRVTGADSIYIVGDMFYRCDDAEAILKRLHGKKHLVIGNHDSSWMDRVDLSKHFAQVCDLKVTTNGRYALTLCHYPLLTWKREEKSYMIHGHIHANTDDDFFPLICKRDRLLNAGVDVNGYAPVSFDELLENNRRFKSEYAEKMAAQEEGER